MKSWIILILAGASLATGCATPALRRHLEAGRWSEAAAAIAADSTILRDDEGLFAAATLHGTPGRATYDPVRAMELLQRLLVEHPRSSRVAEAVDRLALLQRIVALERQITELKAIDLDRPTRRQPRQ
jgi:hypothetical protein